jgi:ABC-type branched-subunit amino acid transport system permease subunit
MALGLMFIVTMIFAPEGVLGKFRAVLERRKASQMSVKP